MALKVSDVAAQASVSADAVRFYEREGLLPAPPRSPSGYREYEESTPRRIQFIKGAPGFPADFIDHAFEPFTRVDAARGRTGGGAGLGLAIVKAVAESHGGNSVAGNRPEGGATVSIEVPA